MDRVTNPYTPNAGSAPPVLAGRDLELEDFEAVLLRLMNGRTDKAVAAIGLRGVGKTVLLGEFERIAVKHKWVALHAEVSKTKDFGPQFANLIRKALFQLSPKARWTEAFKTAAGVIRSFSLTMQPDGSLTAGLDVEAIEGMADSGQFEDDLTEVLETLGIAAAEVGRGVVFLLDEIQFLTKPELEALISAIHRCIQKKYPVIVACAGLPQLPGVAGDAKSYAERLFHYIEVAELHPEDAAEAIVKPARDEGVEYDQAAVDLIVDYTEGYPYFLQEFGRAVWDLAEGPRITLAEADDARYLVEAELDESFFKTRVQRSTTEELRYLRAMAALGPDEQKASDVAEQLHKTSEQVAPLRARLISKGLLYTPRFGYAKFTVPQFDKFMMRFIPDPSSLAPSKPTKAKTKVASKKGRP